MVHVTLHTALRNVFDELTEDAVLAKARLADEFMTRLTGSRPRIGICALNPHAGESGLFGDEERTHHRAGRAAGQERRARSDRPAADRHADGPARDGEFDAVVAMYHDQGHIALKLLGMHRAVNVTLGLPIIRTSVAHGTAFDIAWKRHAETEQHDRGPPRGQPFGDRQGTDRGKQPQNAGRRRSGDKWPISPEMGGCLCADADVACGQR